MMMEKLIEQEAMMEQEDQKVRIERVCARVCVGEVELLLGCKTGPRMS